MPKDEELKEEKAEDTGMWEIPIPEGAQFGGVAPGAYLSRCIEEPKESVSSKGEPQTEFQFAISDPEFPELEDREGRYWCSRKPKAWWNLTQTLEALGVSYVIDKEKRIFRFDPLECVGKPCKTVWEENEYKGRVRARIQRVISPEEEIERLTSEEEDKGGENLPF